MYLSDEKIIDLLVEYITDERYKQAILLDGEWGSGKTFFIQEKLISSLSNITGIRTKYNRSIFYISLYGIENFSQIIDEIYTASLESYFDKKLGEGNGEKVGRGINFASKVITAGLKYFNVDANDLPKISDVKQLKNAIVIFDDLERCNIDINQLFGFINNLVEHNDIKVIIVANQAEIGRAKLLSDLPQKYSVVLNPQLKLQDGQKINQNVKSENTSDIKQINQEQLIQLTDQLFSEDMLYEKVKEKLIGLTIFYQANFNAVYENLVEKYVKLPKTQSELLLHKELVIEIFNQQQHFNIRTLIFAIIAYEKFSEILNKISFKPQKYLDQQKEKILKYTIESSIHLKLGKKTYSWSNSTASAGIVYWDKSGIYGKSVFGYRFVDIYLLNRYLNNDEVKSVIMELIEETKKNDEHRDAENALTYNKIYHWWTLEDSEIMPLLQGISKELSELKYHPRYFKDIIITLMQLQHFGFKDINLDDFIPAMKLSLINLDEGFKVQALQLLSDDVEFIQKYNQIARPLFDILDNKERKEKEKINESLNLDESWGEKFYLGCCENKSDYMNSKKFFFYIEPAKVISRLQSSNVKDIYFFLDGINEIYSFSNLNDFFKNDTENIREVLACFKIDELVEGKITKKIALEKLKKKLDDSLELILK